ncbi:hypothetical protein [Cryobacterium sp. W22_MBD10_FK3]|uniref:hypothetical protein n=1 Tax=Cryobacterium sp. W22_MBD10_FK3 TaxID=3240273 RepID=UPI003F934385
MTTSAITTRLAFSPQPRFRRALVRALSAYAARWEEHFIIIEDTEPMNRIVPTVRPTIW